ncbi:MAG: hypothetical protein U0J70_12560, partial [Atopobiaceae bacterium]|nr:hypothetical protein [Atopobiaceae bacterium]
MTQQDRRSNRRRPSQDTRPARAGAQGMLDPREARGGRVHRQAPQRRPSDQRPSDRRSADYRASSSGRGQQRRPAPAHSANPPRQKRSMVPIIVAVLLVLVLGAVAFFVLRSCGKGSATTGDGGAAGEQATQVAEGTNATSEDSGDDNVKDASTTGKNKDGSVDINLLMVGD